MKVYKLTNEHGDSYVNKNLHDIMHELLCIMEFTEGEKYTIEDMEMSEEEYNELPEFEGF